MAPAFYVAVVGLCVSLISLIVIPIAGLFFTDRFELYIYEHLRKDIDASSILLLLWVLTAIIAGWFILVQTLHFFTFFFILKLLFIIFCFVLVCQWHFASVINSLRISIRKSMAKKKRPVIVMYPNSV